MNDSIQYADLSEGERLELYRRRDEALAVSDEALRQFVMKHALEEHVRKAKNESKWFWIIGAIGLALDYFVFRDRSTGFDFDFNFGTFIFTLAVGGSWATTTMLISGKNRRK